MAIVKSPDIKLQGKCGSFTFVMLGEKNVARKYVKCPRHTTPAAMQHKEFFGQATKIAKNLYSVAKKTKELSTFAQEADFGKILSAIAKGRSDISQIQNSETLLNPTGNTATFSVMMHMTATESTFLFDMGNVSGWFGFEYALVAFSRDYKNYGFVCSGKIDTVTGITNRGKIAGALELGLDRTAHAILYLQEPVGQGTQDTFSIFQNRII